MFNSHFCHVIFTFSNAGYWWVGQNDQSSEAMFKNINDPAHCPGVFLDWQIDANQPNGGSNQNCIAFNSKSSNSAAFHDKSGVSNQYGVLCKAISGKSHTTNSAHHTKLRKD